jgi:hypothetical protein
MVAFSGLAGTVRPMPAELRQLFIENLDGAVLERFLVSEEFFDVVNPVVFRHIVLFYAGANPLRGPGSRRKAHRAWPITSRSASR